MMKQVANVIDVNLYDHIEFKVNEFYVICYNKIIE